MTVEQLIEELKKWDKNLIVVTKATGDTVYPIELKEIQMIGEHL